jgi:hypothetical protein
MLKYGDILQINSGNSRTLIPRSLTYTDTTNNDQNVGGIGLISSSTIQTSANFNTASIIDLNIETLNLIPNTLATSIVVSSPIAFSFLKSDYQIHNFSLYPILFSESILIKNKNLVLDTEHLTIKDNVIMINSSLNNSYIDTNQSDNIISGFIFPIADQNISTGYYAGLLYVPNNKIQQVDPNSSFYNWTNNHYNYFTNLNKGFFKLKYLPQSLSFSTYNNTMDQTYIDLIDNNINLANLQVNAIGLNDGEIVSLTNSLALNLSDGTSIFNLLNLTKTDINIINNLAIKFVSSLVVKDINNNQFISLDGANSLIKFYQNLLFNNLEHQIFFNNILKFTSGTNNMIKLTGSSNRIELFGTTLVDNLQVLSSFELNNIPFTFVNTLNIVSNGNVFISFDSVQNTINILQPTYINVLNINNSFSLSNNIPFRFSNTMYIRDINNIDYMYFNGGNVQLTLMVPTYINNAYINTSLNLMNDIPIIVANKFTIQTAISIFAMFEKNNTSLYNNLLFKITTNPSISFNSGLTLNIRDNKQTINLGIDSTITIKGPTGINSLTGQIYSYQDISNTIVSSSFNITNTKAVDYNLTFTPVSKVYVLSGITQIGALINYTFVSVLNINNMSGKLTGTTWSLDSSLINTYDINIWSYPGFDGNGDPTYFVGHTSLTPININNQGNWSISRLYLSPNNIEPSIYDLTVECIGSVSDRIVWGFKLDILQI